METVKKLEFLQKIGNPDILPKEKFNKGFDDLIEINPRIQEFGSKFTLLAQCHFLGMPINWNKFFSEYDKEYNEVYDYFIEMV